MNEELNKAIELNLDIRKHERKLNQDRIKLSNIVKELTEEQKFQFCLSDAKQQIKSITILSGANEEVFARQMFLARFGRHYTDKRS